MRRTLSIVFACSVIAFAMCISAIGQETTGNMEIIVKDAAEAVVPSVPLTITGAGFKRTVTTDDSGFVRIIQVPPGSYSVTAAATAGFVTKTIEGIAVGLGRTTPVSFVMGTTVGEIVTVSADDSIGLDLTDTKVQTTISAKTAELIPKGLNFSSVLKFSAATRPEPRSGQFQIDGASGSENTFIIDGQEVTDILSGALDRNVNLPFSIIAETQIKSSGFEAEFGGATGGVINVVTKSGGNGLNGEFGFNGRTSGLEPIPGVGLSQLGTGAAATPLYYTTRRDSYRERNPTASLLGPIWKNRVWFSVAYAPQVFERFRSLRYKNLAVPRIERYRDYTRAEKTFGRIDAQPFSKLHLTSTVLWSPEIDKGVARGYAGELGGVPTQARPAGQPTFDGAAYSNQLGGRLNSINFTSSGSYLISSKIVASLRYGHYFLNNKLGSYGQGDINIPSIRCAKGAPFLPGTPSFPATFGCVDNPMDPASTNGFSGSFFNLYDATARDQVDGDVTYSFHLGGDHELKAGYQRNAISNKVLQASSDTINLNAGRLGTGTVGGLSGHNSLPTTPGALGAGVLTITQTAGDVHSKNEGIFVQDKWQPLKRLTLNLGLRGERENVPSYTVGLPGINFDAKSKIAPRIGASFDLTGDGKNKVSGFYGLFYDRFKLTLPRGSFGGDKFHHVYFEFFANDNINSLNRATILGAGVLPPDGGACPEGATAPVYGRVRCDIDERINSNSNSVGQDITEVGGVDPNLKPFRQREITFTFQRQLNNNYLFSSRYSRKQVIRTIEDVGFVNSQGSTAYLIANPGEGLAKSLLEKNGLIAPKAQRQYDALELRIDRRFADHYFFSANYTYSRLYGNYGGLASSDEEGRLDPNVERYFDEPSAGFTAAGGPDNGLLPTDRPHVLKAFGTYRFDWNRIGLWKNNSTDFDLFYTVSSGSVVTSFVNIRGVEQIVLTKRGDQGRTPVFSQTDFALRHNIKFGRDGRFNLKLDADIINLFNQYIVTNKGRNPDGQGGNIKSNNLFDVLNPDYGLITAAQVTACNTPPKNTKPCYVTAFKNFQQNGAPNIIAAINGGLLKNPFYNLDSSYQARRTIRYGIRFVF